MSQFGLRKLMIGVTLAAGVFGVARWLWTNSYDTPYLKKLIIQATPLIHAIDSWNAQNGRYPESLAEAGLSSPTTDSGPFDYHTGRDGSYSVHIWVSRFGEGLFWESSSRGWATDGRFVEIGWSEREVSRW